MVEITEIGLRNRKRHRKKKNDNKKYFYYGGEDDYVEIPQPSENASIIRDYFTDNVYEDKYNLIDWLFENKVLKIEHNKLFIKKNLNNLKIDINQVFTRYLLKDGLLTSIYNKENGKLVYNSHYIISEELYNFIKYHEILHPNVFKLMTSTIANKFSKIALNVNSIGKNLSDKIDELVIIPPEVKAKFAEFSTMTRNNWKIIVISPLLLPLVGVTAAAVTVAAAEAGAAIVAVGFVAGIVTAWLSVIGTVLTTTTFVSIIMACVSFVASMGTVITGAVIFAIGNEILRLCPGEHSIDISKIVKEYDLNYDSEQKLSLNEKSLKFIVLKIFETFDNILMGVHDGVSLILHGIYTGGKWFIDAIPDGFKLVRQNIIKSIERFKSGLEILGLKLEAIIDVIKESLAKINKLFQDSWDDFYIYLREKLINGAKNITIMSNYLTTQDERMWFLTNARVANRTDINSNINLLTDPRWFVITAILARPISSIKFLREPNKLDKKLKNLNLIENKKKVIIEKLYLDYNTIYYDLMKPAIRKSSNDLYNTLKLTDGLYIEKLLSNIETNSGSITDIKDTELLLKFLIKIGDELYKIIDSLNKFQKHITKFNNKQIEEIKGGAFFTSNKEKLIESIKESIELELIKNDFKVDFSSISYYEKTLLKSIYTEIDKFTLYSITSNKYFIGNNRNANNDYDLLNYLINEKEYIKINTKGEIECVEFDFNDERIEDIEKLFASNFIKTPTNLTKQFIITGTIFEEQNRLFGIINSIFKFNIIPDKQSIEYTKKGLFLINNSTFIKNHYSYPGYNNIISDSEKVELLDLKNLTDLSVFLKINIDIIKYFKLQGLEYNKDNDSFKIKEGSEWDRYIQRHDKVRNAIKLAKTAAKFNIDTLNEHRVDYNNLTDEQREKKFSELSMKLNDELTDKKTLINNTISDLKNIEAITDFQESITIFALNNLKIITLVAYAILNYKINSIIKKELGTIDTEQPIKGGAGEKKDKELLPDTLNSTIDTIKKNYFLDITKQLGVIRTAITKLYALDTVFDISLTKIPNIIINCIKSVSISKFIEDVREQITKYKENVKQILIRTKDVTVDAAIRTKNAAVAAAKAINKAYGNLTSDLSKKDFTATIDYYFDIDAFKTLSFKDISSIIDLLIIKDKCIIIKTDGTFELNPITDSNLIDKVQNLFRDDKVDKGSGLILKLEGTINDEHNSLFKIINSVFEDKTNRSVNEKQIRLLQQEGFIKTAYEYSEIDYTINNLSPKVTTGGDGNENEDNKPIIGIKIVINEGTSEAFNIFKPHYRNGDFTKIINLREKLYIISVLNSTTFSQKVSNYLNSIPEGFIDTFKSIEASALEYKAELIKKYGLKKEDLSKTNIAAYKDDKEAFINAYGITTAKAIAALILFEKTGEFLVEKTGSLIKLYKISSTYLMGVNIILFVIFAVIFSIKVTDIIKAIRVGKINSALCNKNILERETPRYRFVRIEKAHNSTLTGIYIPMIISTVLLTFISFKLEGDEKTRSFAAFSGIVLVATTLWLVYALHFKKLAPKASFLEYQINMKQLMSYVYTRSNLTNFSIKTDPKKGKTKSKTNVSLQQSNEGMRKLHDDIVKRILALENLTTKDEAEGRYSELVERPIELFGYTQFDLDSNDYANIKRALDTWKRYKTSDTEIINSCYESLRWLSSSTNNNYNDMKYDFTPHYSMCFLIFVVYSIIIYCGYHSYYRYTPITGIYGLVAFLVIVLIVIFLLVQTRGFNDEPVMRLPSLIPVNNALDTRNRLNVTYKLDGYDKKTFTVKLQQTFIMVIASYTKLLTSAITLNNIKDDGNIIVTVVIKYNNPKDSNNAVAIMKSQQTITGLEKELISAGFDKSSKLELVGIPSVG